LVALFRVDFYRNASRKKYCWIRL